MSEQKVNVESGVTWAVLWVLLWVFSRGCDGNASHYERYLDAKYDYRIDGVNYSEEESDAEND